MPPSKLTYDVPLDAWISVLLEDGIDSGFIGHTIGSGKTLAPFKASTVATLRDTLLPQLLSGELAFRDIESSLAGTTTESIYEH